MSFTYSGSDNHNIVIEQRLNKIVKELPKPGTEISGNTLLGLYEDLQHKMKDHKMVTIITVLKKI